MDSGLIKEYSYLDQIRIYEGANKCGAALKEDFTKNMSRAVSRLNDSRLTFPCLYILIVQIQQLRIQKYLTARNRIAMRIAEQIIMPEILGPDYLSIESKPVHSVLSWIMNTGVSEEIPDSNYEEILDVAASQLINKYRDVHILPIVADLIFRRNRNGHYIHDLVWVLFQSRNPLALKLIAERINSSDPKDSELSAELLNISEADFPAGDIEGQPAGYLKWLDENDPYLYFTGESFQYASNPVFCAVDLERKYLQKGTPAYDWQPVALVEGYESQNLAAFKQLERGQQKILSDYSHKIRRISIPAWQAWMRKPLSAQLKTATDGAEASE